MKTIGILGGMSPEASIDYYRGLIDLSRARWRYRCPRIVIYNLDMEEWADRVQDPSRHSEAAALLASGVAALARAGADFVAMASNTPHMFLDEVVRQAPVPILSIVEATAREAERRGFRRLGLMGTAMVMEGSFYAGPFADRGLTMVLPRGEECHYVHREIVTNLVAGDFREETRRGLIAIARRMAAEDGIEALILGCTELPLVMNEENTGMPVLETSRIHVRAIFEYALGEEA